MVGWRSPPLGLEVCGVVEGANVNILTREGALLVGWEDSMIGIIGAEVGGKVNASVGANVALH